MQCGGSESCGCSSSLHGSGLIQIEGVIPYDNNCWWTITGERPTFKFSGVYLMEAFPNHFDGGNGLHVAHCGLADCSSDDVVQLGVMTGSELISDIFTAPPGRYLHVYFATPMPPAYVSNGIYLAFTGDWDAGGPPTGVVCIPCNAGTYRNTLDEGSCVACDVNTFS